MPQVTGHAARVKLDADARADLVRPASGKLGHHATLARMKSEIPDSSKLIAPPEYPLSTYFKSCLATIDEISKIAAVLLSLSTGSIGLLLGFVKIPDRQAIPHWTHSLAIFVFNCCLFAFIISMFYWLRVSQSVLILRTRAVIENQQALVGTKPLEEDMKSLFREFKAQRGFFFWAVVLSVLFIQGLQMLR